jgi:hypothetical protein
MRFKVGDKVKFLNERGGGKIVAIIDSKLVKVETEDGFELPVLNVDLIKDFRAEQSDEMDTTHLFKTPSNQPVKQEEDKDDEEERSSLINPWGTIKEEKGIYFVFVPHEQQWVLTGDMDIYLINHTDLDILFSIFFKRPDRLQGIDFGSVTAKSKWLIDTISRDQIEDWCDGIIQVLFHKDDPSFIYLPLHAVINLKPSRFYKEGSYQANTLLQEKALLLSIAPEATFEKASGDDQEQKFGTTAQTKIAEEPKKKPIIDKHKKALFEAEVDLHIGELIDNIAGLSNHDMFNIQLEYFKKCLESAISNDYQKITFIHGVGNGVLKNAIVKELENYEGLENKMASISKFGVGAIDVIIKSKE